MKPSTRLPPQYPPRKLWSRDQYGAFERTGLREGQHYELIEANSLTRWERTSRT
jgi:hypothetical protein